MGRSSTLYLLHISAMFLSDNIFKYVKKKKSTDYYSLLVTEKAQSRSIIIHKCDFIPRYQRLSFNIIFFHLEICQ